jgi:hypothetical protein
LEEEWVVPEIDRQHLPQLKKRANE